MIVTYKNGMNKESITVSSNIKQFQKYLCKYTRLEENYLKYKMGKNVNKEMLSEIQKLENVVFCFESIIVNDTQKKSVANFNDIMVRLNKNTNNSFASIEKKSKKEQKSFLKLNKSRIKSRSKELKKISKSKTIKNKRGFTTYGNEQIEFSGKLSQVIKEFSNSAKKSINFHGVTHDTHKFDTASYPHISNLLKNRDVAIAKELEKTQRNRKIEKIEKKYEELCYKTNICNLLEQAIKCCDVSIMPKTKKELEEKYDKIKKETENMRIQLNSDIKYLEDLSHGAKIEKAEKDIIDKSIDVAKDMKDSTVKTIDKISAKIEEKKDEKKIDTTEDLFEKIVQQKISELDDSLSFSAGANFKKFKYLSEEQQYAYKGYLENYLTKRVGESFVSKALMDAKFEARILEKFYGVKKEKLIGINEPSQISRLDDSEKQYLDTYMRKLEYVKSEEMFKEYESKVRDIYRKHKTKINSNSPLVEASLEKLAMQEKKNGGRSL